MDSSEPARAVIWVHGRVHGVGFRWWARARALELGLVALLEEKPSTRLRPGEVTDCVTTWGPPRDGLEGFVEK